MLIKHDETIKFSTIPELVNLRATLHPERTAYTCLTFQNDEAIENRITYKKIDEKAKAVAALLQAHKAAGERALLLYPPGLEYIIAFYGCMFAGVVAVPAPLPLADRLTKRFETVIKDAEAKFILTTAQISAFLSSALDDTLERSSLTLLETDKIENDLYRNYKKIEPKPDSVIFLQYTSGSTSAPKGTIITHRNVLSNLHSIQQIGGYSSNDIGVSWLPHFHDMGLVGFILHFMFLNAPLILMSPADFLVNPYRWLRAISKNKATISGSPNFGYDLCIRRIDEKQKAEIDLSSWKFAWISAEPIRADTLQRFADAFSTCGFKMDSVTTGYGLAEATFDVTGMSWDATVVTKKVDNRHLEKHRVIEAAHEKYSRLLVGSGIILPGITLRIVDPDTLKLCSPYTIGEIWISGENIARGYWNRKKETEQTFHGFIADTGEGPFLRTGDLGFLDNGELFVTGRLKDLIIIHGENHYPQDIELTVEACHPLLRRGCNAAFSIDVDNVEKLVIVQEVKRDTLTKTDRDAIFSAIRNSVAKQHRLAIHEVVLINPKTIPKTSSGKIRRSETRANVLRKRFDVAAVWNREIDGAGNSEKSYVTPSNNIERKLIRLWESVLNIANVDVNTNFFELGGTSAQLAEINSRLDDEYGMDIPIEEMFAYPTIRLFSQQLRQKYTAEYCPDIDYQSRVQTDIFLRRVNKTIHRLEQIKHQQTRASKADRPNPAKTVLEIAVIGMAGRFPGADDIDTFWQNLIAGRETISFFSNDELEVVGLDKDLLKHPEYVKAKGVVNNKEYFDASFFGYTPKEAALMDPQVRIFHETVWNVLEDAGYSPKHFNGSIGLYAGASPTNYAGDLGMHAGISRDFMTTRISYALNLKGPSYMFYTACSTSLVAIHIACQALLNYECDMAVAGGVTISPTRKSGYLYQKGMMTSPDGHCRAFDAASAGTVFGEGAGAVMLKRLEEALADGDVIHAVIKGSAVNNDGDRKVGYSAPSGLAQTEVIRAAHRQACIEPESIGYVETHGTGTYIGDPIEIAALKHAFNSDKKGFCKIGTVKTNVGHLDTAAGITGFIKTVLALKHRQIPPTLHFTNPNPKIDFEASPFTVNREPENWARNGYPLRAGVSAFGMGGTNAHVVVEASPERNPSSKSRMYQLLVLSANSELALERMTQTFVEYLKKNQFTDLADIAYTLLVGRHLFPYRKALVCATVAETIDTLSKPGSRSILRYYTKEEDLPVVFMFSGLGSQYVDMGLELYQHEHCFKKSMDTGFDIFKKLSGCDIKTILYPSRKSPEIRERLSQTEIIQPLLFIFEYALAEMLRHWGVKPFAMIGYSFGEYVAACISGVFSFEDALWLVIQRGELMQKLPSGAMLSVPLPEGKIRPLLTENVSLAIVNGSSCIVAGSNTAIQSFEIEMRKKRLICTPLAAPQAVHTNAVDSILDDFQQAVCGITLRRPQIPYISNVTGTWITVEDATDPKYWARHMRSTVRFSDGMQELVKNKKCAFVEIGPGSDLCALANRFFKHTPEHITVDLIRNEYKTSVSDQKYLLNKIGKLWLSGTKIAWGNYYDAEKRYRLSLPNYPFERQFYWISTNPATETVGLQPEPHALAKTDTGPSSPFAGIYDRPFLSAEFVPPQTKIEAKLIEMWRYFLGYNEIGIYDNFFELGGDSSKAIKLISMVQEELGVKVPTPQIFKLQTVKEISDYIQQCAKKTPDEKFLKRMMRFFQRAFLPSS